MNLSDFRESILAKSLCFSRVDFFLISLILESRFLVNLSDFIESILSESL